MAAEGSAVQPTSFFLTYVQQQKVSPSMMPQDSDNMFTTGFHINMLYFISRTGRISLTWVFRV